MDQPESRAGRPPSAEMIFALAVAIIHDDLLAAQPAEENGGDGPEKIGIVSCSEHVQDVVARQAVATRDGLNSSTKVLTVRTYFTC